MVWFAATKLVIFSEEIAETRIFFMNYFSVLSDYRFQADIFAMYRILRQNGYQDDHIVLICEDDVANKRNNPHPGELRVSDTCGNLYVPSARAYPTVCLSQLPTPMRLVMRTRGVRMWAYICPMVSRVVF